MDLKLFTCIPEPGKMCPNPATYNVWFEGTDGFYSYMCDKHASNAVLNGVHGYKVQQITRIEKDTMYPIPKLPQ